MSHRLSVALLALGLLSGCTDLVTIDVGRGRIAPIEIERELVVGGGALLGCPKVEHAFASGGADASSTTAFIEPVTSGCRARLELTEALLVDRGSIRRIADTLEGFDRTALVGFDVELDELALSVDGARLTNGGARELSISLDGQTVLSADEPEAASGQRVALPESVVDAFFEAIDADQALRVDLELELTFREGEPLPNTLGLHVLLQPILRVDVVRAAF